VNVISAARARNHLHALLDEVAQSHEPIQIAGKKTTGVLVSAEDWAAVQETLYLLSVPGMRESILKGMKTPIEKCSEDPGW
jgi:antitoxin YefM